MGGCEAHQTDVDAYLEDDISEELVAFSIVSVKVDMIGGSKYKHQRPQPIRVLQRKSGMLQQSGNAFHLVWQV